MITALLSLSLVITLIFLFKKGLEFFSKRNSSFFIKDSGHIKILETKPMGHQRRLVLIEENGFQHLICLSPSRDFCIQTRPIREIQID